MTILGYHTAHELSDLMRAKDSNVADLEASVAGANTSAPGWPAWSADYQSFRAAWDPVAFDARTAAAHAQTNAIGGWDTDIEESRWNAVLSAIAPLDDLVRRWTFGAYVNSGTPQPSAPDADLGTLNTINALPIVGANAKTSTWKLLAAGAAVGVVAIALLKRAL